MADHNEYPHDPGYLYGCMACESECFCTRIEGSTEYAQCVFCASLHEEFYGWAESESVADMIFGSDSEDDQS